MVGRFCNRCSSTPSSRSFNFTGLPSAVRTTIRAVMATAPLRYSNCNRLRRPPGKRYLRVNWSSSFGLSRFMTALYERVKHPHLGPIRLLLGDEDVVRGVVLVGVVARLGIED